MAKMKAVQVPKAGGDFQIVEREIPQPGPGHVRIRVMACGVCHSDVFTKEGLFPGITYPRVPGHEIAGVIDEVGAGVTTWKKAERVGVGWHDVMVGDARSAVRSLTSRSTTELCHVTEVPTFTQKGAFDFALGISGVTVAEVPPLRLRSTMQDSVFDPQRFDA